MTDISKTEADMPTIVPVLSPSVDEKNVFSLGDAAHEIGIDYYREAAELDISSKDSRRILRMIDWRILPIFCITQGLSYVDKVALNYGNLYGLQKDQGINTSQYAWYSSAFYLGYLFCAWPANLLLQKYNTGKVMGIICVLWGVVSASMAGVRSFAGGLVNRVVLGGLEAFVTPGLGMMTPLWWTLQEQPVRHLTWYCFNGVADVIGNLTSYGVGHITSSSVPTWGLIFIIFGVATSLWGFFMFFYLPDSPASAKFFNDDQKRIAIKRIAGNRTGTKNTKWKMEQAKEAFLDPKTWLLFFAAIAAQIPGGVITTFSTAVISSFGFTTFQTSLLGIPADAIQVISLVASGYFAGKFKNSRAILMFIGNSICIIAAAALTYSNSGAWGKVVAYWFTLCQSVGFSLSLVMISANFGGYTKRQTVNSITFVGYCLGFIAGPHVILASESKIAYPTATKAMMACYVVKTSMHVMLGLYMWYWNRRWDREAAARGDKVPEDERLRLAEAIGMTDVTEWHNPYFRYVL